MREQLQKVTLNLYEGDFAELQALFPDVGASVVVRKIVRRYIEQINADNASASPETEVKL